MRIDLKSWRSFSRWNERIGAFFEELAELLDWTFLEVVFLAGALALTLFLATGFFTTELLLDLAVAARLIDVFFEVDLLAVAIIIYDALFE